MCVQKFYDFLPKAKGRGKLRVCQELGELCVCVWVVFLCRSVSCGPGREGRSQWQWWESPLRMERAIRQSWRLPSKEEKATCSQCYLDRVNKCTDKKKYSRGADFATDSPFQFYFLLLLPPPIQSGSGVFSVIHSLLSAGCWTKIPVSLASASLSLLSQLSVSHCGRWTWLHLTWNWMLFFSLVVFSLSIFFLSLLPLSSASSRPFIIQRINGHRGLYVCFSRVVSLAKLTSCVPQVAAVAGDAVKSISCIYCQIQLSDTTVEF